MVFALHFLDVLLERLQLELAHQIRSGNYDRNRGQMREAQVHYLAAIEIERRNARALAGLARVALAQRNGGQAVRWARRLVEARPRNAANHVLLGDAHRLAGNRSAARREWSRALELYPGLASARRRLRVVARDPGF